MVEKVTTIFRFLVISTVFLVSTPKVVNSVLLVNLTDYKLSTADEIIWENPNTLLIPDYFEELEFECNSTHPTEWVMSFNPLEDDSFKQVPRIKKVRIMTELHPNGSANYLFSSSIRFYFKYSAKIQTFSCQTTQESLHKEVTLVTTQRNTAKVNLYIVKFSLGKDYLETLNRYGSNDAECSITIALDLVKKRYDCRVKGTFPATSKIYSCRNPDECRAILDPKRDRCKNAISFRCDLSSCVSFNPKVEPGVIVCKNGGNSLAVKYYVVVDKIDQKTTTMELYDEKASPRKYLSISQYDQKIYDGESVDFFCTGSQYIFTEGFQWAFATDNGTQEEMITAGGVTSKIVHHTYTERKTITFNKSVHKDVTGIICYAPIWNSVNSSKAVTKVTIDVSIKPTILAVKTNYSVDTGNFTLACPYHAIPKPKVSWIFWNRTLNNEGEWHRIVDKENVSEITIFNLQSRKRGRGGLTCRVENFLGVDSKKFYVKMRHSSEKWDKKYDYYNYYDILIGTVVGMIVLIIIILWIGWLYIRWMRKKNLQYVKRDIQYFLDGNPNIVAKSDDICLIALKQPYSVDYDIPLENIEMDRETPLGSGAFGVVLRGTAIGGRCIQKTDVAIKTLRPNVEPTYFRNIMTELKVMIYVGHHENIVNLLGSCTENIFNMELYIIMEYCHNGELEKYLRSHRQDFHNQIKDGKFSKDLVRSYSRKKNSNKYTTWNSVSTTDLITWALQISCGMEYLASKKVIHADLATRNILLNQSLIAKICDFGLSRQLYQYTQYVKTHQSPLPWRWMAIESLRDLTFSTETDVWAYGVLLWEIFSLAEVPYPGYSWNTDFLRSLINGSRLNKPTYCPDEVDILMKQCWEKEPTARPTFSELRVHLKSILQSHSFMPGIPEEEVIV